MKKQKFSEAMNDLNPRYLEEAMSYHAKRSSVSRTKRSMLPLVAALMVLLLIGTAAAVAVSVYRDSWHQKPSTDPVDVVRTALEGQRQKEYAVRLRIDSVEIDEAETKRVVEEYIKTRIADRKGWSDEYLDVHFVVVRASYYAEYDHSLTTRSDGDVLMDFYLAQDLDSMEWTIVDNTGNLRLADPSPAPTPGPAVSEPPQPGSEPPTVPAVRDQIFAWVCNAYTRGYSPFYDGLHYELISCEEERDGERVTATLYFKMYWIAKGWDVPSDEGTESMATDYVRVFCTVGEDGMIDTDSISAFTFSNIIFHTPAPGGEAWEELVYDIPLEEFFRDLGTGR